MTTIRCKVYGPDAPKNGFDELANEWNSLLQRTRFNSFFLTHEWQTIWWQNLGVGDLWILAFYAESDEGQAATLVGIAPLYFFTPDSGPYANQPTLTLVGCTEVSDYLDLIIEHGREEDVYQAFIRWLWSSEAPQWQRLDLCNLPEESLTYEQFPKLLAENNLNEGSLLAAEVDVSQEDVAPFIAIPSTYEAYLQTMVDKKQRHELRRKQRRIEREATCEFYIVGQDGLLRSAHRGTDDSVDCKAFNQEMDEFLRLQMASRDDKAEFMTDEMASFFRNMSCFMQNAGYLRLCFLRLDGVNAATVLAFEYEDRLWLYNSGYDPEIFAALSPGWVILSYTIQYAIAAGLKVYDFMQGDEAYKYRFGAQDYKVMRVIATR